MHRVLVVLVKIALLVYCTQGQLIRNSCSISCPRQIVEGGCNCGALSDELDSVQSSLNKLTSIVLAEWSKASNNRWYRLFRKQEPFKNAAEICKQHGALLASAGMRNLATISEVIRLVGIKKNEQVWIGLNDMDKEGTWVWEDGSSEPAVNWRSGQPDNNGGHEDCVHFWIDFEFNDVGCNAEKYFLCETDRF